MHPWYHWDQDLALDDPLMDTTPINDPTTETITNPTTTETTTTETITNPTTEIATINDLALCFDFVLRDDIKKMLLTKFEEWLMEYVHAHDMEWEEMG